MMEITEDGRRELGAYQPLPEGAELAQFWLNNPRLQPAHKKVLAILLAHPDGMTAPDLATASDYEYSGGFRNILATLRTTGVITGRNADVLKAAPALFD